MNTNEGVYVQVYIFLTSALVGGEWFASSPGRFAPEERAQYPSDRRLGGPQSGSGCCGELKILDLTGDSNFELCHPALSHSLFRLSLPGSSLIYRIDNCVFRYRFYTEIHNLEQHRRGVSCGSAYGNKDPRVRKLFGEVCSLNLVFGIIIGLIFKTKLFNVHYNSPLF
jgi:hypothetical protein